VSHGRKHNYLGMVLDYTKVGAIQVAMFDYIENMLSELPPTMDGESRTPAPLHLFDVNEEATKLNEAEAQFFHHYVAKLLFLCKRARPDIQTAVAFLSTRVQSPDVDDYKKLARTMRYLRATSKLRLTLQADDLSKMNWWVDASFAVHPNMRSHTGVVLSFGGGAIYGSSTKQKLNTRSSTEAELVGVIDALPQVLWTRQFLIEQGFKNTDPVIFQDNQSAMLLEKHGRLSSGKRTRHIDVRYYFVKDRIASKEVRVEYCPTGDMLADYFTKPLQGGLFVKFRDMIMNSHSDPA